MKSILQLTEQISKGEWSALTELYGNDHGELQKQSSRYLSLLKDFSNTFDHKEAMLFSSPGRTEVGGNHTDHNHGCVLAGAVNLDNIAVASPNGTNKIRIKSSGYQTFEIDLNDLNKKENEFFTSASLVKGIVFRLNQLGLQAGGFDACIDGQVPKGSGLSSSASFEVLIGVMISHLFNDGKLDPLQNAMTGQWAENNYFGKPCGLMDQTACSLGGLITIDFKEPVKPVVKKVNFDFLKTGYSLVITDTGGSHADLNDEYASLPAEMKSVAKYFGKQVLRETTLEQVIEAIPTIRKKNISDRALLRAMHFHNENQRVLQQVEKLEQNDFKSFLNLVIESGQSSFMYNQNIFPCHLVTEQGLSLALALSEHVLKGHGAWRVHGGGFAGTIQAFVPQKLIGDYIKTLEHVFGKGSCHQLFIREKGAVKIE